MAFVFGLQTLSLIDFTKIFQLKGLKPKNKGHTNFYECCDLTEKVYLMFVYILPSRIQNISRWQGTICGRLHMLVTIYLVYSTYIIDLEASLLKKKYQTLKWDISFKELLHHDIGSFFTTEFKINWIDPFQRPYAIVNHRLLF